jgi:hypothetical protein
MKPTQRSYLIDQMRWVAAVLMILNHAGVRWLSAADASTGMSGFWVHIGSFAPVLFFFLVGAGVALSSQSDLRPVLWKAGLLVLADQIFYWQRGAFWGLDFFGFIGISLLLVTLIKRSGYPLRLSIALMLCLCLIRWSPFESEWLNVPIINWITGRTGITNVSYPLAPWLVFPILGLCWQVGVNSKHLNFQRLFSAPVLMLVAACLFGLFLVMQGRGSVFFRWSTMSLSFFIAALALCAFVIALLKLFQRLLGASDAWRLSGPESYYVVPIHYFIVTAAALFFGKGFSPGYFLFGFVLLLIISFTFTRVTPRRIGQLPSKICLALLLLAITYIGLQGTPRPYMHEAWILITLTLCAQLCLGRFLYPTRQAMAMTQLKNVAL